MLGWEEWLALPDLGLPAIRAKIDTGAKTSALHAFAIEAFGQTSAPMVRFGVHPIPGREDIVRYCTAAVTDRREITSSNGVKETRFVIRSRLVLDGRDRGEIETTLTNRESMAYRMLLGRQAIRAGVLVDPGSSFLLPRLSHRLYDRLPPQVAPQRRARIALLASNPERPSNGRLRDAATRRGHVLDVLPLDRLRIDYEARPAPRIVLGEEPVADFDAVLSRAGGGEHGLAESVIRHLEHGGAIALNSADAIEATRDPHHVASALHLHGLSPRLAARGDATGRCLVIDGQMAAARGTVGTGGEHLAVAAARALRLGLAAVDVVGDDRKPAIARIDVNPSLTGYGYGSRLASMVVAAVETRLQSPLPAPAEDADD